MNYKTWQDGRIKLYNGDCLELMENMQDKVNLVLIDPPYGLLDHKIETNIDIELFLKLCKKILNDNDFLIYFGQQPMITDWNYIANKLFNYKNEVIWYKRGISCPFTEMKRVFENIMIYCSGKKKYNDVKIRYTDILENMCEFISLKSFKKNINLLENLCKEDRIFELKDFFNGKVLFQKNKSSENGKIYNIKQKPSREIATFKFIRDGFGLRNLLSFNSKNNDGKLYNHPTIKPLELIQYLILICSQPNDLVFDGFSGSGTTAISCIKTNRRFIGCELDKEYFNLACNRIDAELKQGNLF